MNPLEERLSKLEMRVTRYRNFNVLLCLLLLTVVTVAARESNSPFRAKSAPDPMAMPEVDAGVPNSPDRGIDAVTYPNVQSAGKLAAQTQDVIRTRRLEIVNSDEEAVVVLTPSTRGGGLIYVNSANDKNLVYIGSSASNGDGLVHINSTDEKNLVALGSHSETGDGRIYIKNRNEERLIRLSTNERSGWIRIEKTGNENLVFLGASTLGDGLFSLSNKSGKSLVSMWAGGTAGGLELTNKDDKRIAYLGTDIGGEGLLKINSKTGAELITLGSNTADNGLIRVSNSYGTLGVALVAGDKMGVVRTKDAQDRLLVELTATQGGDGLVRTWSMQGITTWSSASVQGNTGTTSLRGDMDNDGDIDGDDFLIFSENFGKKR